MEERKIRRDSEVHAAGYEACRVECVVPLRRELEMIKKNLEAANAKLARIGEWTNECLILSSVTPDMETGDVAAKLTELLSDE